MDFEIRATKTLAPNVSRGCFLYDHLLLLPGSVVDFDIIVPISGVNKAVCRSERYVPVCILMQI